MTTPSVGPYRIISELGRGAMGRVLEAVHPTLERRVAVKVLRSTDARRAERFLVESQAVARLDHPCIVRIYDAGAYEAGLFIAMELVQGEPASKLIQRGQVETRRAVEIARDVAQALAHAHERGIVHRDVKPENVLVSRDGRAKLADFGLARLVDDDRRLTATQELLGTPYYIAPETFVRGSSATGPPADVYALGAVLYELLCAHPPFEAGSVVELAYRIEHETAVRPSAKLGKKLDPAIEDLCLACLAKDPAARPPAHQVAKDLDALLARAEGRGSRPLAIAMIVAAFAAGVAVGRSSAPAATVPVAVAPAEPKEGPVEVAPFELAKLVGDGKASIDAPPKLDGGELADALDGDPATWCGLPSPASIVIRLDRPRRVHAISVHVAERCVVTVEGRADATSTLQTACEPRLLATGAPEALALARPILASELRLALRRDDGGTRLSLHDLVVRVERRVEKLAFEGPPIAGTGARAPIVVRPIASTGWVGPPLDDVRFTIVPEGALVAERGRLRGGPAPVKAEVRAESGGARSPPIAIQVERRDPDWAIVSVARAPTGFAVRVANQRLGVAPEAKVELSSDGKVVASAPLPRLEPLDEAMVTLALPNPDSRSELEARVVHAGVSDARGENDVRRVVSDAREVTLVADASLLARERLVAAQDPRLDTLSDFAWRTVDLVNRELAKGGAPDRFAIGAVVAAPTGEVDAEVARRDERGIALAAVFDPDATTGRFVGCGLLEGLLDRVGVPRQDLIADVFLHRDGKTFLVGPGARERGGCVHRNREGLAAGRRSGVVALSPYERLVLARGLPRPQANEEKTTVQLLSHGQPLAKKSVVAFAKHPTQSQFDRGNPRTITFTDDEGKAVLDLSSIDGAGANARAGRGVAWLMIDKPRDAEDNLAKNVFLDGATLDRARAAGETVVKVECDDPPPGTIDEWLLLGPIDGGAPRQPPSFATGPLPREGGAALGLRWRRANADRMGAVDLRAALQHDRGNVVAWAVAEVSAAADVDALLQLGSDDGFVLWLDGEERARRVLRRALLPDEDLVPVHLAAGKHRVVLAITNVSGSHAMSARITGADLEPIAGVRLTTFE